MSRTLVSLAHALAVAPSTEEALRCLAEAVADVDRVARVALITVDQRRAMLTRRLTVTGDRVNTVLIDTTTDHLPTRERMGITAGGQFIEFGDKSDEYARLLQLPPLGEPGWLAVRGLTYEASLCALLAVYEPRKLFGMRTTERVAPSVVLFELAYLRLLEREARVEAVETLEDLAQRVHSEYARKLTDLERRLDDAATTDPESAERAQILDLEQRLATTAEHARRTTRRADAVEATVSSAVAELEKAHIELHRRGEQLRQRNRTLYLIDRVLTLDRETDDPKQLADGLVALACDDMQATRGSLMLSTSDAGSLCIAASRGLTPGIIEGTYVPIGRGVAGKVASSRQTILVQDVEHAKEHPLLHDEFFTTGSFISFPLEYRGKLIGVINLANRAQRGVFVEDDIDRVRVLGSVIALVTHNARLCDRLVGALTS